MRKLLTLLLSLTAVGALAAPTGVKGRLIDAQSGQPVADADVMLRDQGLSVTSGSDGFFQITNASSGTDVLEIMAFGFDDKYVDIDLTRDIVRNIGDIRLSVSGFGGEDLNSDNFIFDDERIADDESAQQSVGTIQGATDDIFYQAASYQYSVMRYRMRGLPSSWQAGYINGVKYNDAMRGMFNYSGLGGMTSSAFRNKTTDIGMASAASAAPRISPPMPLSTPPASAATSPTPTPTICCEPCCNTTPASTSMDGHSPQALSADMLLKVSSRALIIIQ